MKLPVISKLRFTLRPTPKPPKPESRLRESTEIKWLRSERAYVWDMTQTGTQPKGAILGMGNFEA